MRAIQRWRPRLVRLIAALAALAALSLVAGTGRAAAQGPRGAGPDARTPAAGMLRIGVAATWTRNAEVYEGSGAGSLRALGTRFSFDTLGASVLRFLGPIESVARVLTGSPDFRASLGASTVRARHSVETTPLAAEYGITSRLALGVMVPFVTTASRVDVNVNPLRSEATVGLNPARFASSLVASNALLLAQFDSAGALVSRRIASCAAQPSGTGCGAINTNPAAAQALVQQSAAFVSALATMYGGRGGSPGALFVPLAGGVAQAAIDARIAGFKAQFAAFGATQVVNGPPFGAPAPVTSSGFQAVLADSAYGIIARPLGSVVRRGVGDIDVSAQFTWHDSYAPAGAEGRTRSRFWWRSALAATVRLATGAAPEPDALVPLGNGDHQSDVELRSLTDIGLGARTSVTTVVRVTRQSPSSTMMRIADSWSDPFPEAFRTATVTRDPGDEIAIDLYPRIDFSEAMSLAAHYGIRSKAADAYEGTVTGTNPAGATVTANASALDEGTGAREHRFGAILAYSTVAAWQRGRARWPLELSIAHFQTTAGSGGAVPKLAHDAVQVRWYWRPFGR